MAGQVAPRLFTTDEYHRMAGAGILTRDDRVELIEGEIVRMSPIGGPHQACVDRLNSLLVSRFGKRAIVRIQGPVILGRHSEPQPDISVLRPRADFYAGGHPRPPDVLFLVEVIDTSGSYDRGRKLPLYSRSRIPEVWLVDLERQVIDIYRQPALRAYRLEQRVTRGQRLRSAAFPRLTFAANDILG
jgi:Uma2 family endonuclease